jgi:hypothetical protein
MVRMQVGRVHWKVDLTTLAQVPAETLGLNDIGRLTVTCHQPLYYDAYAQNRATGLFVIVDALSNNTVGAGMILPDDSAQDLEAALREAGEQGGPERTQVSASERAERLGQTGVTVRLDGERARAIAFALERRLYDLGHAAHVLAVDDPPAAARACTEAGLVTISVGGDLEALRGLLGAARVVEAAPDAATLDAAVQQVIDQLVRAGQLGRDR